MDLDKIKNTWQNTEIKSSLTEENIQQILSQKGQSAFNKIKFYEKTGIILFPLLIILNIYFIVAVNRLNVEVNLLLAYFFTISSLSFWIWNIYKFVFLKRINLDTANIMSILRAVETYKKYMSSETIILLIWITIFIVLLMVQLPPTITTSTKVIIGSISWIVIVVTITAAYQATTKRNLQKLEKEINKTNN